MSRTIKAIYEDGVLKPLEPLYLAEHAETYVTVEEEASRAAPGTDKLREYTGPLPRQFHSAGIGKSGRGDFSERAEELLDETFGRNK